MDKDVFEELERALSVSPINKPLTETQKEVIEEGFKEFIESCEFKQISQEELIEEWNKLTENEH